MHHVAIMKKSWRLIPKILSGAKTIESRWYQIRRMPWDNIAKGDTVFFKNAGEMIVTQASVSRVVQYSIRDAADAQNIVEKYGKKICIVNPDPGMWGKMPKYCILVFLKDARLVDKPFHIDKTGFGNASAWITVDDIRSISC